MGLNTINFTTCRWNLHLIEIRQGRRLWNLLLEVLKRLLPILLLRWCFFFQYKKILILFLTYLTVILPSHLLFLGVNLSKMIRCTNFAGLKYFIKVCRWHQFIYNYYNIWSNTHFISLYPSQTVFCFLISHSNNLLLFVPVILVVFVKYYS